MISPQGSKYFIKTFGCQMNVADSERMSAILTEQGLSQASCVEQAQVILINGCTVREKAVHKAVSALGELQELKKKGDQAPLIGIGGCVGQLDQGKLFKRAPYLDFVFGTDTIDHLPEILFRVKSGEKHVVFADFDSSMDYSIETKVLPHKAQAYVNIMKGCDKYCTYCIVPYTRGREKSRTIDEVVQDVARLVASGVIEVTLLGQNVNSFGKGNPNQKGREPLELHNAIGKVGPRAGEENFPQLLRAIDADPRCSGLKRIRFTSSHPLDFSDELIQCYAPAQQAHLQGGVAGGVTRLAPHLHLPVQSGSNAVLQKMGRHHQIETYIAQMQRLREIAPHVGLSTDLIVGFPTETDQDFEQTLQLLDLLQFDHAFAFAYSSRPGTRAAKMQDDVALGLKKERLNILLAHQLGISEKRYAKCVGEEMEILVEGPAKNQNLTRHFDRPSDRQADRQADRAAQVWTGRTGCNRVVNVMTSSPRNLTGRLLPVRISGATRLSLEAEWTAP
jgi:tRNA-2-methylthio-N6-dimethylallyladenosine synthase